MSHDETSHARSSIVPNKTRGLRACLLCSLIKTFEQFVGDGCDNCENVLQLRGDDEKVSTSTSTNYDGMISMLHPKESWVAKWQGIQRKVPGVYAISVAGELPPDLQGELRSMGIAYRPGQRDKSIKS